MSMSICLYLVCRETSTIHGAFYVVPNSDDKSVSVLPGRNNNALVITGPCKADQLNCTLMGVTMAMGPFLGNGGFAL